MFATRIKPSLVVTLAVNAACEAAGATAIALVAVALAIAKVILTL